MADIGRLNKRITFFCTQSVTDKHHRTTKKMAEFTTVWASVEANKGSQYKDVEADKNSISWNIYTRRMQEIESADFEIHYGNRIFKIDSVFPCDKERMLHFICREVIQ